MVFKRKCQRDFTCTQDEGHKGNCTFTSWPTTEELAEMNRQLKMSSPDFVFEIIMENWPEFPGNELYTDKTYAEFCGRQDYIEAFYPHWVSGQDDGAEEAPGDFTWEFISKNLYHMYEDGYATEVALRIRHVNSLGE